MNPILLLAPDGSLERKYWCERLWGRIFHNGHWYRSQHKRGAPDIYMRGE